MTKSPISRFEDLGAWQKSRQFAGDVYAICRQGELARDRGMRDQIQRAAVSIMNNLAEGFDRWNPRDMMHFCVIAKSSAAEVRSMLYLCLDVSYIDQNQFDALLAQVEEIGRMIGGLRASLSRKGSG